MMNTGDQPAGGSSTPADGANRDNTEQEDVFHDARSTFSGPQLMRIPLPKMPAFSTDNSEKWFKRLDVQLQLIGAKNELDKYRGLLSYLDEDLLMTVTDWISQEAEKGPVTTPFTLAKSRLITLHQRSLVTRLRGLMNIKPADGLPSQYLRSLIQEAGDAPDMRLIAEIWEDNLPDYMSTIIHSDPTLPLEAVAQKLDQSHKAAARRTAKAREPVPALSAVNNIAAVDQLATRLDQVEMLLTNGPEVFVTQQQQPWHQQRFQQQQNQQQHNQQWQNQQQRNQQWQNQQQRNQQWQSQQQRQPQGQPQTQQYPQQYHHQYSEQYQPQNNLQQPSNRRRTRYEHAPNTICNNCRIYGVNVRNCKCPKNA